MIELVSIYHHFYPQRCFGGSDFCCMNVNPEFAFIMIYFQSQKIETRTPKCITAFGNLVGMLT